MRKQSASQFYDLFREFFRNVEIREAMGNTTARCYNAMRVPWEKLEKALRFEFDLPYPDGSKMGFAEHAINAFKTRYDIPS